MISLVCQTTGARYPADQPRWCSDDGGLLDVDFSPAFNPHGLTGQPYNLWRYHDVIPLERGDSYVSLGEFLTPLVPIELGGRMILIKQEQLFPTGSYKDRGAAVLISKARELGIRKVVQDSSGNAGVAIAAYSARAGIACEIYVPENTSSAKLGQLSWYGAKVHRIPGSREETAQAALEAARTTYYASHCWNPFFLQGTKTFAYEVCEQMDWTAPDVLVLPAGNGTIVLGAAIGFGELMRMDIIDRLPRIIAVQSEHCAPLARAFLAGTDRIPEIRTGETLAEGISIARPVRGKQILEAVRKTGGTFVTVSDEEIISALKLVASEGFYVEPTAGATIAGLCKWMPMSSPDERIVTAFTGHGLKSTEKMTALYTP